MGNVDKLAKRCQASLEVWNKSKMCQAEIPPHNPQHGFGL